MRRHLPTAAKSILREEMRKYRMKADPSDKGWNVSGEEKETDISKAREHEHGLTQPPPPPEPSIKPQEARQEVMKGEESYRKCRRDKSGDGEKERGKKKKKREDRK